MLSLTVTDQPETLKIEIKTVEKVYIQIFKFHSP